MCPQNDIVSPQKIIAPQKELLRSQSPKIHHYTQKKIIRPLKNHRYTPKYQHCTLKSIVVP